MIRHVYSMRVENTEEDGMLSKLYIVHKHDRFNKWPLFLSCINFFLLKNKQNIKRELTTNEVRKTLIKYQVENKKKTTRAESSLPIYMTGSRNGHCFCYKLQNIFILLRK